MFDFLNEDWFIITLEVVFLIFIVYDIRRYMQTKKKEYITNIVLTVGFFIWAAIPFYNAYFTWNEDTKEQYVKSCELKEKNATLCSCIAKEVFKEFNAESFDKNTSKYKEYYADQKKDCLDDSWF